MSELYWFTLNFVIESKMLQLVRFAYIIFFSPLLPQPCIWAMNMTCRQMKGNANVLCPSWFYIELLYCLFCSEGSESDSGLQLKLTQWMDFRVLVFIVCQWCIQKYKEIKTQSAVIYTSKKESGKLLEERFWHEQGNIVCILHFYWSTLRFLPAQKFVLKKL